VAEEFHPTLLTDDEKAEGWRFTQERAVYASVILHLLLIILFFVIPPRPELKPGEVVSDPLGLVKMMAPDPPSPRIPVQFFSAPGPQAPKPPKPEARPLPSDLDRVAHGGDPQLPKAAVPRSEPKPGIQDLAAGERVGDIQKEEGRSIADDHAYEDMQERSRPTAPRPLVGVSSSALAGLTAEQAGRLARTGTAGDGGAGFARDGGFVDSGPLSFDTTGYDWGAYAAEMIRRIKRNWDVPGLARDGIRGRVTIRFYILKNGQVADERILSSSGIPPFDNAAFQAIAQSSAFRPLPDDLGHEREGVTVTFFYNIRPEDEAVPARR